jgi:hypothetical protein
MRRAVLAAALAGTFVVAGATQAFADAPPIPKPTGDNGCRIMGTAMGASIDCGLGASGFGGGCAFAGGFTGFGGKCFFEGGGFKFGGGGSGGLGGYHLVFGGSGPGFGMKCSIMGAFPAPPTYACAKLPAGKTGQNKAGRVHHRRR